MPNFLARLGISDAEMIAAAARDVAVHEGLKAKANEAQEHWKDIAPVFGDRDPKRAAPPQEDPGAYRDAVEVGEIQHKKGLLPRIRVFNNDYKAHWIEFGAKHMPEYAPATNTDLAMGGDGKILTTEPLVAAQAAYSAAKRHHESVKADQSASRSDRSLAAKELERARFERSQAFKAARGRRGRRR